MLTGGKVPGYAVSFLGNFTFPTRYETAPDITTRSVIPATIECTNPWYFAASDKFFPRWAPTVMWEDTVRVWYPVVAVVVALEGAKDYFIVRPSCTERRGIGPVGGKEVKVGVLSAVRDAVF